jgi:hypothetical protein
LSAFPRAGQSRYAIPLGSQCSPRRAFKLTSFIDLLSDFEVAGFAPHGPRDAGELVGESDGGLVVAARALNVECPGLEAIGMRVFLCGPEDGAGALDEKHADIGIAPLGDGAETADKPARVFPGSEAEEACEVATGGEATDVTDEGDECGGSEDPDARDGLEALGDGVLSGERLGLALDIVGAGFEMRDFGAGLVESEPQRAGDGAVGIFNQGSDSGDDTAGTHGDEDADLAEHAAGGVDAGGAIGDIGGAIAVERGYDLLVDGFYGHGADVLVTERFEESFPSARSVLLRMA